MVEMQFRIYTEFFWKVAVVSDVSKYIPDPRHSDRERTVAQVKFSFKNNKL